MSTLAQQLATGVGGALQRRYSRRGVIGRAALVGSAAVLSPLAFAVRPGTAYASVCGPGASCGDGWTAMCCSITGGVNQCPPGSFAGGWWKADSAGLCGGGARYYIDCQGECTGCGCGGGNFCAEGCWNCSRHCNGGSCDERRVCWNVFRYGQCNQQVGCSGPVLCRMISCTPPWHFENCTADVATDNNTTDHSAPCLPGAYTAIQRRYDQLGGPGSVLGPGIGPEYGVPGGSAQATVSGRLYDSAAGVFWLHGPILATFDARGGQNVFGLPTSDETAIIGGAYVSFTQRAWIISSSAGTWPVRGGTLDRWYADGRDRSPIGLPTGDPVDIGAGAVLTRFQRGLITSGPAGSFTIAAPIAAAYDRFGPLSFGAATGQATVVAGGREQRFARQAAIFASGAGAFLVPGQILAAYDAHSAAAGVLGFPVADPIVSADRRATVSRFGSGDIVSSAAVGTHEVHGPIATTWRADGAQDGSLGLPVTDVHPGPGGTQISDFEGGRLTYDPATGQVTRS